MSKAFTAPALLVLLTLAFLVAPSLTPPFRGYLPGQMPVDIGRAAIQPAGYAFAIWGGNDQHRSHGHRRHHGF